MGIQEISAAEKPDSQAAIYKDGELSPSAGAET